MVDEDADSLLRAAVSEAARLLESDGAMIYRYDDATNELVFAHDAGVNSPEAVELLRGLRLPVGRGLFGTALERRQLVATDDYAADARFSHHPVADRIVEAANMRAMAGAPMFDGERPIGVLGAFSSRPGAFSAQHLTLLRALADHAAAAIGNLRLFAELRESEERLRLQASELERTLAARNALDEIARRIVDVEDPADVLQQVVDVAARLLHADGGHLTYVNEDGKTLVPIVMAGRTEESARAWLHSQRFPIDGGINGLSARTGRPVWTSDYVADPRWPHDPDDDSPARLELGAVVVAPLRGPGAEVIGTIAITYREPREIDPRDVSLLEELARQGSIAARNARLLAELRDRTQALEQSERRYRHLVDHSPDLVWSVDAEGRLTYTGETLERLTGYHPERIMGLPWTSLLSADSLDVANAAWDHVRADPDAEQQFRVRTPKADGGTLSAEINMIGTIVDGRFAGAHGSLRDITERDALEEDLRRRSGELAANEERAKLARELHDSVTQALFSMGLTLRSVELLFERDPAAARAKLSELRDLQNDALAEMRTLIFELRPRGLEADGLGQALRNHAAAVAGRTGLEVGVELRLDERLPLHVEETLYRIGQEALHNVVKHAGARSAQIRLRRVGTDVELVVEDDGAGFDPAAVSGAKLGLVGMRQRAEQIGGKVTVSQRPGGGTMVVAIVPCAPSAE